MTKGTVGGYQVLEIDVPLLLSQKQRWLVAGEMAGTTFLGSGHQLCTVYSTRSQGSRKWEKKDTAKLVVEDAGDVTAE